MSVSSDLVGANGLLEDIGIAVYESMTDPGKWEVRDLCDQLRRRIEEIKRLNHLARQAMLDANISRDVVDGETDLVERCGMELTKAVALWKKMEKKRDKAYQEFRQSEREVTKMRERTEKAEAQLVAIPTCRTCGGDFTAKASCWECERLGLANGQMELDEVKAKLAAHLDRTESTCSSVLADMGIARDPMCDTGLAQLQVVASHQCGELMAMREALGKAMSGLEAIAGRTHERTISDQVLSLAKRIDVVLATDAGKG